MDTGAAAGAGAPSSSGGGRGGRCSRTTSAFAQSNRATSKHATHPLSPPTASWSPFHPQGRIHTTTTSHQPHPNIKSRLAVLRNLALLLSQRGQSHCTRAQCYAGGARLLALVGWDTRVLPFLMTQLEQIMTRMPRSATAAVATKSTKMSQASRPWMIHFMNLHAAQPGTEKRAWLLKGGIRVQRMARPLGSTREGAKQISRCARIPPYSCSHEKGQPAIGMQAGSAGA